MFKIILNIPERQERERDNITRKIDNYIIYFYSKYNNA